MTKILSRSALLMTESKEDYEALQASLEREIMPRSFVESIYVADIATLSWEILRLRRAKAGIINANFEKAIVNLLEPLLGMFGSNEANGLARRWFTDSKAKKEIAELLGGVRLDEFAIEAEAIRLSSTDLELLDRMLSACEARRNRALRSIEDYRVGFAKTVRESSDRELQENKASKIGFRTNKISA
jgi:hypothetical protein